MIFDYVDADKLEPGMWVNHTTVNEHPADNFLVLEEPWANPSLAMYIVRVLNSAGKQDVLIFEAVLSMPQVRVVPR